MILRTVVSTRDDRRVSVSDASAVAVAPAGVSTSTVTVSVVVTSLPTVVDVVATNGRVA
ncbi:MAG TPA: hypothetical protein PLS63_00185 [Microthrixaceae bacterium]|nr:hypothetical protein [Microthrixaceae bacterium]HPU37960.1 hypothetical protein [Microthrixaceae bacterium]